MYGKSMRKVPQFHLISWCENFVERHSFRKVSGAETASFHKTGEITVFFAVLLHLKNLLD